MRIIDAGDMVLVPIAAVGGVVVLLGSEFDRAAIGQDQIRVHVVQVQLQKTLTDSR